MQALLAIKAHKARCIKILTVARKAIEEEADNLVEAFTTFGIQLAADDLTSKNNHQQQSELDQSPGEPFTPSPPFQAKKGK
jgi:hypothetical protein